MRFLGKMIRRIVGDCCGTARGCVALAGKGAATGGSGEIKAIEQSFDAVTHLALSGAWDAVVKCGQNENHCRITLDSNLADRVSMVCEDGLLSITLRGVFPLVDRPHLELSLCRMPEKLSALGNCVLKMEDAVGDRLNGKISGASNLELNGTRIKHLELKIVGASKGRCMIPCESAAIAVSGAAKFIQGAPVGALDAEVVGASNLKVKDADTAKVAVAGASRMKLAVRRKLTGDLCGASVIKYSGKVKPDVRISGMSKLKKVKGKEKAKEQE